MVSPRSVRLDVTHGQGRGPGDHAGLAVVEVDRQGGVGDRDGDGSGGTSRPQLRARGGPQAADPPPARFPNWRRA
jgi:hypothetical protein